MRALVKKIGIPLLYVALGVALTIAALIGWIVFYGSRTFSEEQVRSDYVREYSRKEQDSRGIQCSRLRAELQTFLTDMGSALKKRPSGQDWRSYLSEQQKSSLSHYSEFVFTCRRLYESGDKGRRNDLQDLSFTNDVQRPLTTMETLVKFGPSKNGCDAVCVDKMFAELERARQTISAQLQLGTQKPTQ